MLKLTRWLKAGKELDDWLEDMRAQLHLEVDYAREARMTQRMAELVADDKRYSVPLVYAEYSSGSVLALSYMAGDPVTSAAVGNLSQVRRNQIAVAMLDLFFHEIYAWDVMQSDPNFGNYRICIRGRGDHGPDQLVLLDFGAMVECSDQFLDALGSTVAAGQAEDTAGIIAGLTALGCLRPDSSENSQQSFAKFCLRLLEPLRDAADLPADMVNQNGQYRWADSMLIKRAGTQAAESAMSRGFSTPSREFAFVARKLTGVFTFIAVLEAEFNGAELLKQHLARWSAE